MYFYGKADFENFDGGNKVEWYLPNGLGDIHRQQSSIVLIENKMVILLLV